MTDAKMALLKLVEQEADAGLVREMLACAAKRMMNREIKAETGVPAGTPLAKPPEPPQRLPRPQLGHACGPDRAGGPHAEEGQLLPEFPRAEPHAGEGVGGDVGGKITLRGSSAQQTG